MFLEMSNSQTPIPFYCNGCPFSFTGRCNGPINRGSYFKDDKSVHSCIVPIRREKAFSDTYDRTPILYKKSYQNEINLPSFIPEIKTGLNLANCKGIEVFAISLRNIVGTKGTILVQSVTELKRRYKLPKKCRLVLIGTAKDEALQKLWANSDRLKIWEHIAKMGFDWITGFSFSVWDDDPRTDQIINQDRNFLTHDYFVSHGIPTIPFVFPFNEEDYESYGDWMSKRKDINIVAIFATSYSHMKSFAQLVKNMRKIQKYARRKLKFLVVGASTKAKIRKLMSEFDVCIVASKPFQAAKSGEICTDDLKYESNRELTRDELALSNFEKNLSFCDSFGKTPKKIKIQIKEEIYKYEEPRNVELSNLSAT